MIQNDTISKAGTYHSVTLLSIFQIDNRSTRQYLKTGPYWYVPVSHGNFGGICRTGFHGEPASNQLNVRVRSCLSVSILIKCYRYGPAINREGPQKTR
jgi:hypothetical protein